GLADRVQAETGIDCDACISEHRQFNARMSRRGHKHMDIDLNVLRVIEQEREIPLDTLVELIEQALFLAYQKTEGAWPDARAELDKSSGEVRILAVEFDNDDNPIGEFD